MGGNAESRPAISIDLRKYRIRIHKKTLHYIGDPEYILLLVNPDERTLAILQSNSNDPRAHHMDWTSIVIKKSIELYSRALLQSICDVCCILKKNQSYRIYGEIIPDEGMARFYMSDATQLNEVK